MKILSTENCKRRSFKAVRQLMMKVQQQTLKWKILVSYDGLWLFQKIFVLNSRGSYIEDSGISTEGGAINLWKSVIFSGKAQLLKTNCVLLY